MHRWGSRNLLGWVVVTSWLSACGGAQSDQTPQKDSEQETSQDVAPATALIAPVLRWPPLGHATGSIHASQDSSNASLRPRLRWNSVEGTDTYEIELTSSCQPGAFASCQFAHPELRQSIEATELQPTAPLSVSTVPPVGRRYYWRVRACRTETCSGWSEIRYFDVGRLPGDLNGDGYEEVVVGDVEYARPGGDAYDGRALVYQGSASGLSSEPVAIIGPREGSDGSRPQTFGAPSLIGDINADGFPDLLLRSRSLGDSNILTIVEGNRSLGDMEVRTISAPRDFSGFYGSQAGDFDGDGYGDVALSCGEGGACIRFGSAQDALAASIRLPQPRVPGPPIDNIGQAITSGDFDGDGYSDVAVYFRQCLVDHLAVYRGGSRQPSVSLVLRHPESDTIAELREERCNGSDLSPEERERLEWEQAQFADEVQPEWRSIRPQFRFGILRGTNGLAAIDLNRDGHDDLVVARPRSTARSSLDTPEAQGPQAQHRISVLYGGHEISVLAAEPEVLADDQEGGLWPVASGRDLSGDGYPDLAVGRGSEVLVYSADGGPLRPMETGLGPTTAVGSLRDIQGEGVARLVHVRASGRRCLLEAQALNAPDRESQTLVLPRVPENCSFRLE